MVKGARCSPLIIPLFSLLLNPRKYYYCIYNADRGGSGEGNVGGKRPRGVRGPAGAGVWRVHTWPRGLELPLRGAGAGGDPGEADPGRKPNINVSGLGGGKSEERGRRILIFLRSGSEKNIFSDVKQGC